MPRQKQHEGHVLIVDDDPDICQVLGAALLHSGFQVDSSHNAKDMKAKIKQRFYDVILLDIYLGEDDGLELIPHICQQSPYSKIIIMSGSGTIELAVDSMKRGASTFISKSKKPEEIVAKLKSDLGELNKKAEMPLTHEDFGIIGQSPEIKSVISQIKQVSAVDSTVLVLGDSGTGKELVARAIHECSNRSKNRFAAINCGAIPRDLLESELFGHKRGAFTDAKTDRKGVFEICSDGTLFLDEIGEMPIDMQVKLLRVLQEREITPLGSTETKKVNTRVVAATNKNLIERIKSGHFREDLYYRLSVISIYLPPLSERKSDIPLLVDYFLKKLTERFDKPIQPPSREVLGILTAYSWPGNIRELQNCIERGVILTTDGQLHVENIFQPAASASRPQGVKAFEDDILNQSLSEAKQVFEREYLKHLLELTRGNISEMAKISERYRADIYRLLTKHGLEWDEFRTGR